MIGIVVARWCLTSVQQSMSQWAGITLMHRLAGAASILWLGATGCITALVGSNMGNAIIDRYGAEVPVTPTVLWHRACRKSPRRRCSPRCHKPPHTCQPWLTTFHDRVEAIGGELLANVWRDAASYIRRNFTIAELEAPLG